MKKNILSTVLLAAFLIAPAMAFTTEPAFAEEADDWGDTTESQANFPDGEHQGTDLDFFDEGDEAVNETWAEPVATIAGSEEEGGEISANPGTVSAFDAEGMRERWEALFSKDAAPDSVIYTVKPGDSLYVLARKNHTTVELIKKINGLKSDDIYIGKKLKIHTAPFSIVIDKSENTLVLYSENLPVRRYSVATGKNNSTPAGDFKITDKLINPTWFKSGAILPPGSPENGLGSRWMGFDKPSYGIHGTIEPESIGTQASEGCIRMLNEDVEELYGIVPPGTKVTVQD